MSKNFIILIIIACLIISSLITVGLLVLKVNKDRGNHLQKYEENIHGKRALIVYQPSITALTNKVVDNIANGLKNQGINVDINYAGSHISKNLSHYDIIIYGSLFSSLLIFIYVLYLRFSYVAYIVCNRISYNSNSWICLVIHLPNSSYTGIRPIPISLR